MLDAVRSSPFNELSQAQVPRLRWSGSCCSADWYGKGFQHDEDLIEGREGGVSSGVLAVRGFGIGPSREFDGCCNFPQDSRSTKYPMSAAVGDSERAVSVEEKEEEEDEEEEEEEEEEERIMTAERDMKGKEM